MRVPVPCIMDRLPDVPRKHYIADPVHSDNDLAVERTIYSHDELFPDGMRYHASEDESIGSQKKVVDMKPFPIYLAHHGSTGRWLRKGSLLAHFDDTDSASVDFATPLTGPIAEDVNLTLYFLMEVLAQPHLKTLADVHAHFCNIADGNEPSQPLREKPSRVSKKRITPLNKIEEVLLTVDTDYDHINRDPLMDVPEHLPLTVLNIEEESYTSIDFMPSADGPPEQLLTGDDLKLLESAVSNHESEIRFQPNDYTSEDRMDYLKNMTPVTDEELLKQFSYDHMSSPDLIERLKTFLVKGQNPDVFREY
ncbi:hypothetical protein HDU67_002943, partial [Dinochytrium kinnereticum]